MYIYTSYIIHIIHIQDRAQPQVVLREGEDLRRAPPASTAILYYYATMLYTIYYLLYRVHRLYTLARRSRRAGAERRGSHGPLNPLPEAARKGFTPPTPYP